MLIGLDLSHCNPIFPWLRFGWGGIVLPPAGPTAPGWFGSAGDLGGEVEITIYDPPAFPGDGPLRGDGLGVITGYRISIAGVVTDYGPGLPINFVSGGHAEGLAVQISVWALGYLGRPGLVTTLSPIAAVTPAVEPAYLLNKATGEQLLNKRTGEPLLNKRVRPPVVPLTLRLDPLTLEGSEMVLSNG